MTLGQLKEKSVAIIGVGKEGQAIARYLVLHKINPTLLDEKGFEQWEEEFKQFVTENKLNYRDGKEFFNDLEMFEVIFRSPGFRRLHPSLVAAEEKGSIVTSQTKWFFEHNPATIIGITGTKGKGTTTTLIYQILQSANREKAYLTGNIGKQQPLEFLDQLKPNDLIAYELSSFQLQDLSQSPHIGICLMVTSDHLDHHLNLDEYHEAKKAITSFQGPDDIAIYNADYEASSVIGLSGQGQKFAISAKHQPEFGAFINDETIQIKLPNSQMEIHCQTRMLRGKHNLENIAAASIAAASMGISREIIEKTIKEFKGLEHRLQFIATKEGVSYYNDSISTVPDTTIAAVKSFTEPAIVIIGGSDKGIPFDGLIDFLNKQENVKAIITMGATGQTMKDLFKNSGSIKKVTGPFQSLEDVMISIKELASSGDVVLLSPATASFDMFKNYEERGTKFVEKVLAL